MLKRRLTKWKFLAVIGIIFLIALVFRIYHDIQYHQKKLDDDIGALVLEMRRFVDSSKMELELNYATLRSLYMNRPLVIEALEKRDRQHLFEVTEADFNTLKSYNQNLMVMQWNDTKNRAILRMHKPESFDDNLSSVRPIIVAANREQRTLSAFEVGKNGITYRVALPLLKHKTKVRLGVLEFGVKPEYFTKRIQQYFDVKAEILLRSDALKNLTYTTNFKTVGSYKVIQHDPFFDDLLDSIVNTKTPQVYKLITKEEHVYVLLPEIVLSDINGEVVARIIIARDITPMIQKYEASLKFVNFVNICLLLGSFIFLYVIFSYYEKALLRNYWQLTNMVHSLTLSKERHQMAQEIAHIGNWELIHATKKFYWSNEIYRIFEVEPDVFKPNYENVLNLIYEEDRQLVKDTYMQSIAKKQNFEVTYRLSSSLGSIKYVSEKGRHLYDEKGTLLRTVGTIQDITTIHQLEEKAYTDPLTGLYNRRIIDITFEKELSTAKRKQSPLAVAILDIDLFKEVNDCFGHDIGDMVLKNVASYLLHYFRESDSVGRWGGEEFIVVLPGVNSSEAQERMEYLRRYIAALEMKDTLGQPFGITVSIGISSYDGNGTSMDVVQLFKEADDALYRAKKNGRNRVECY